MACWVKVSGSGASSSLTQSVYVYVLDLLILTLQQPRWTETAAPAIGGLMAIEKLVGGGVWLLKHIEKYGDIPGEELMSPSSQLISPVSAPEGLYENA
jgi:hypothetical protein